MKRHRLFLIVLVAAAAMAFGAGPALADGINFDPATGVFTYFAYPNALANQNDITVRRPATGGFSTWTRIDFNWYVVGDPTPDANVVKYCFKEEWKSWSCPATKVVVRTAKGDDKITVDPGYTGPTMLEGGAGEDVIQGGAGPDEIWGACKDPLATCYGYSDTLGGGAGDDVLHGGDESPVFGTANDKLDGGPGNDLLDGGLGADDLVGGDGADAADYSRRTTPVTAVMGDTSNNGAPGEHDVFHGDVEGVVGGSANDSLYGNYANNVLRGGPGDDYLYGLNGNDWLDGGPGSDVLRGGYGSDTIYGGGTPVGSCCETTRRPGPNGGTRST